jgi:hypothetical protein
MAVAHETRDVSYRGLFLETQSPPALRSLVRLKVTLPSHTFECHAMAVHVGEGADEQGVGLQFWGLSGPDRKAWDDFVRKLMELQRKTLVRHALASPHPAGSEPRSGVRSISSPPDADSVPDTASGRTRR